MIDIPILNWAVLGVELVIAILWGAIFCVELFTFLEGRKVKLRLESTDFIYKKTFWSLLSQVRIFVFNVLLLVITYLFTSYAVEELDTFTILSSTILGLGIIALPRGLFFIFRISPYWVRQLKYFSLFNFIFFPLFIIDDNQIPEDGFVNTLWNYADGSVRFLFPSELLRLNGYEYTLTEKHDLFLVIFIIIPILIAFLNFLLPRLLWRISRYQIYEWVDDRWVSAHEISRSEERENVMAVLLIHGMGSNYKTWSTYTKETNSTRIVDFVKDKIDKKYLNTRIFSLQFSDKLKNHLDVKYKSTGTTNPLTSAAKVNNYVWELLTAIYFIKELNTITKLHLVAHSTGGIVIRKLFDELYTNSQTEDLYSQIGFNKVTKNWDFIDQVSWMAVPHFGAKGGSAVVMGIQDKLFYRYGIRFLYWIPTIEGLFDTLGRALTILGLDAQGANDLDPSSPFLNNLNGYPPRVAIYGKQIWKNAIADQDHVVGKGAIIEDAFYHNSSLLTAELYEKEFQADHGNAPWEQLAQLPDNKLHEYPPIHHSIPAIFWLFELMEGKS